MHGPLADYMHRQEVAADPGGPLTEWCKQAGLFNTLGTKAVSAFGGQAVGHAMTGNAAAALGAGVQHMGQGVSRSAMHDLIRLRPVGGVPAPGVSGAKDRLNLGRAMQRYGPVAGELLAGTVA